MATITELSVRIKGYDKQIVAMSETLYPDGKRLQFRGPAKADGHRRRRPYLDLLFYHRRLRRLVAVELKLVKFKAAYKGQMELYLRWLEEHDPKPKN